MAEQRSERIKRLRRSSDNEDVVLDRADLPHPQAHLLAAIYFNQEKNRVTAFKAWPFSALVDKT